MPYVPKERRKSIHVLNIFTGRDPGMLSYIISQVIKHYMDDVTNNKQGLSYDILNEVMGVLESIKLELYRRIVSPYEDKKLKENGDVF